jgi:hypothetical protein
MLKYNELYMKVIPFLPKVFLRLLIMGFNISYRVKYEELNLAGSLPKTIY